MNPWRRWAGLVFGVRRGVWPRGYYTRAALALHLNPACGVVLRLQVMPSILALQSGPPVRKLLFMTTPEAVSGQLLPYWPAVLQGQAAQVVQVCAAYG